VKVHPVAIYVIGDDERTAPTLEALQADPEISEAVQDARVVVAVSKDFRHTKLIKNNVPDTLTVKGLMGL
jgi:hypothetical protein